MTFDVKTASTETSAMHMQDSEQQSSKQQGLSLPDTRAPEQPAQTGSSVVPCHNTHGAFWLLMLRISS